MSAVAKDVTDEGFAADVLERSRELPVIVDLWAPWCGPCRQLAPVLERVVADRPGEVELVKINIDENPRVAASLNARSIPLVVAFKDGQPVDSFLGAQPESAVRAFLDGLAPSPADEMVEEGLALQHSGDDAGAEREFLAALEVDPRHTAAQLALARLQADRGEIEAALALLRKVDPSPEVEQLAAELRLLSGAAADITALEARRAGNPDDLDLLIELGRALAAQGEHERALELLIDAVRRDAGHEDGAARKTVLDLFGSLGSDHPLTKTYRPQLARALF